MHRFGSATVAAKIHQLEDLSDLRVSDLRTVNCRSMHKRAATVIDLQMYHVAVHQKTHIGGNW
jgi:hypothetical protein